MNLREFLVGLGKLSIVWWIAGGIFAGQGEERPDPATVVFQGKPRFERVLGPEIEIPGPRPMEQLGNSFGPVKEPGQQLFLAVPAVGTSLDFSFAAEDSPSPIALRILGPVKGFRIASAGEPFPGDFQALVRHIKSQGQTDAERALAVFNYIDQNIRQWWFPAEGYQTISLHSEEVARQIWCYGYGFCSDVARIAGALWESLGLPARIVSIDPHHTVAEVFYDHSWHLFDVQHKTYWRNSAGAIASVKEMRADTRYFWQGLDEYGLDPIGYPPLALSHWYKEGDIRFHEALNWLDHSDFGIHLRDGEFFEINYVGRPFIYHPDFWVQAYGEKTLRRDPPWPYLGKLSYVPHWYGAEPEWQTMATSDGRTAYVIPMQSPYLFTEGMLRLPTLAEQAEVFIYAHDRYQYVGPVKGLGARLGRQIAGTTRFAVCIVVDDPLEDAAKTLAKIEIKTSVQISHLSVPKIKPGKNELPIEWGEGQPTIFFWNRAKGPDLHATFLEMPIEEVPIVGKSTKLRYRIENSGSGTSVPTAVTLANTTTGLISETIEQVGSYMIPPLAPGESFELICDWETNTRMTWYGQNPYIQHFELRIDPHRERSDADRSNQVLNHVVLLRNSEGEMPQIPGYTAFPPRTKAPVLFRGMRLQ